nr:anti-sigma factor [Pseudonocardia acidicola]
MHALEPGEELEVLRHLPTCPTCQAAVREAEELLSGLGASVEQVDPPAGLRDSLLSAAEETPQERPAPLPQVTPEDEPAGGAGARVPQGGEPTRFPAAAARPAGGGWLSSRSRKLVAASIALVAALSIGGLAVRTAQLQAERDAQTAQAQSIFDMVAQFDKPGTKHAWLTTRPGASPVAAVMVNGIEQQVVTVGLPPNATDRDVYVLWGMHDGTPQAIGTFDVTPTQSGPHNVGSAPEVGGFSGYAISIEPGRTAPASPSTVVASGQVET